MLHEQSEKSLARSQEQLSSLRESLQKERIAAVHFRDSTGREMSRLSHEKIRLQAEHETLKQLCQSLQEPDTALVEARARIVDERRKAVELRAEYSKARTEWETARDALLDRLKVVEDNNNVLHQTIEEANERLRHQSSKLRETEFLNRQQVSKVSELETKFSATTAALKDFMKQSETDRSKLMNRTIDLSEKLHDRDARLLILEADCTSQASQLAGFEAKIKTLIDTQTILRDRLDLKIKEERSLSELESRIQVLELEKVNIESRLSFVTRELDTSRLALEKCRLSNCKLVKQKERLKDQRSQLIGILRRNYRQKPHEIINSS